MFEMYGAIPSFEKPSINLRYSHAEITAYRRLDVGMCEIYFIHFYNQNNLFIDARLRTTALDSKF